MIIPTTLDIILRILNRHFRPQKHMFKTQKKAIFLALFQKSKYVARPDPFDLFESHLYPMVTILRSKRVIQGLKTPIFGTIILRY